MKAKAILTGALLAFVAASIGILIVKEVRHGAAVAAAEAASGSEAAPEAASVEDARVVVSYLHTTYRCATCRKLEAYTVQAVEEGFAGDLESGRLVFQSLNLDEPDHARLKQRYELYTKSVIVSELRGEEEVRWKNLDRIWDLVGDREAYLRYVREEIEAFRSAS